MPKYKSFKEALRDCPTKDTISVNKVKVTEHQYRWLQLCINKGELSPEGIVVRSGGKNYRFKDNGYLTEPMEGNALSLNRNLALSFILGKDMF